MKRLLQLVMAMALALSVSLPVAAPAAAYNQQNLFFTGNVFDTDGDHYFDLSVCYGDNTGQGVYIGRADLSARFQSMFNWIAHGDYGVSGGIDHQNGFGSNGVCNADGSAVQIHYFTPGSCYSGVAVVKPTNNICGPDMSPGPISQCHIFLNNTYTYSWELPTESGKLDGGAVATHELLHCWGLNHSNSSGQHNTLMHEADASHHSMIASCGSTGYGVSHWVTLDDIVGAKGVYDSGTYFFQTVAWVYVPFEDTAPADSCTD